MVDHIISALRSVELNEVERDLLEVNIKLMTIDDRFNVGLKEIGEDGIRSLLQNVNYRFFLQNFFTDDKYVVDSPGCITIYRH